MTVVGRTVLGITVLGMTALGITVLGALTAPVAVTAAEEDSATALLPYCRLPSGQAGNKAYLVGRCVGLVQGVAETLALVKQADADNTVTQLCVDRPRNVGTGQAVELVVKYGDAHPEQTRAPFTVFAALALTEAWSCGK